MVTPSTSQPPVSRPSTPPPPPPSPPRPSPSPPQPPRPHHRVHLDPRLRPPKVPRQTLRRPHRRHPLHRRRRPPRPPCLSRLDRPGTRRPSLRLAPQQAPAPPRRHPRLPSPRRRLSLRKEHLL